MNGQLGRTSMNGYRWMYREVDGWIDYRLHDGWMDGWMDGWREIFLKS
jgi:hypothetical protein